MNISCLAVNVNETKHDGQSSEFVDDKEPIRLGWMIPNRRWGVVIACPFHGKTPNGEDRGGGADRKTRVESHIE